MTLCSGSPSPGSSPGIAAGPPAQPQEPGPEDCCQRGCKVCVWDVYRDKMDAWTAYMQQHYPHLLQQKKGSQQRQMVDASMDAFAALEAQLQRQQEQQRQSLQQQQQEPQAMEQD